MDGKMIQNLHTHTYRCRHATGTEREYVERAIEAGLEVLGFSDHTPQPYEGGFQSGDKMLMEELEGYVDTVLALQKEYEGKIQILLGLEVEYLPKYFDQLMRAVDRYPFDYLILGQHYLRNGGRGEAYTGLATDSDDDLICYVRQSVEALETGRFTYFAHPDLIHYTGSRDRYRKWMRILCKETARRRIPLEINLLGLEDRRHYPNPVFWQIAAEEGNVAVFGSDAHDPEGVFRSEAYGRAERMAEELHLKTLQRIPLRSRKNML